MLVLEIWVSSEHDAVTAFEEEQCRRCHAQDVVSYTDEQRYKGSHVTSPHQDPNKPC